jgi:spermidine synthase
LLLPVLGSRNSFIVLAALTLGSGLVLLARLPKAGRRRQWAGGAAAVGVFVLTAFSLPRLSEIIVTEQHRGATLLSQEEGIQTTATIQKSADGEIILYLDAHHQAGDSDGIVGGHRRIAHLAMMVHNDPREVLVIGLGGGVTAGAASLHETANIDIVELSDTVVRASEWFRHVNHDVLRRPNVRLRIDDGRNYLRLTDKRYDVLTADIIHPTQAGSGNLYSVEYFRLCSKALKDDGVMLQWISQRTQEEYELIMRTFLTVFPNATLWAKGALIVGTRKPLEIERASFDRRLQEPSTRAALEQFGIKDFQSLLALYRAGPEEMREFLGPDDLVLTDDRPLTEYYLSLKNDGRPFNISRMRRGDVSKHVR